MKKRYKNKQKQELFEWALKQSYPISIENCGLGGSAAHAFNLGYLCSKGQVKKHPRAAMMSDAWVLFYAGKEVAKLK